MATRHQLSNQAAINSSVGHAHRGDKYFVTVLKKSLFILHHYLYFYFGEVHAYVYIPKAQSGWLHLTQQEGGSALTVLVFLLLALLATLLPPLVENTLGLGRLLQAHHESIHVLETVVQDLLAKDAVEWFGRAEQLAACV